MAGMESFQLLDMDNNEDDLDLTMTHVPLNQPASKSGRAGDPRRTSDGSLESLHFAFDHSRTAARVVQPKSWTSRAKRGMGFLLLAVFFTVAGFLSCKLHPMVDAYQTPSLTWQEKIRHIPDFSRCKPGFADRPVVLVISIDGLRYDLVERMPALRSVAKAGLHAPHMRPVFPTATFPNHYSIVTGLYPESHGIIDNQFCWANCSRAFALDTYERLESMWWKGRPIWEVAQEKGRHVFGHYWPGSDVSINGVRPTRWLNFSMTETAESQAQAMIDAVLLPKSERLDLMLTYYHEPDGTGHRHGLLSDEYKAALAGADGFVSHLMAELAENNLLDCVNLLFISDHGMAQYKSVSDPVSKLEKTHPKMDLSPKAYYQGVGPLLRLNPSGLTVSETMEALACESDSSAYQVYTKPDLPRRFHYFNTDTIWPVLLTANISHALKTVYEMPYAFHGWDNLYSEMWASFVAFGPSFRRNLTMEPFANVELFGLLCELLDVEPVANNGTRGSLSYILRDSEDAGRKSVVVGESYGPVGNFDSGKKLSSFCSANCSQVDSRLISSDSALIGVHFCPTGVPSPPPESRSVAFGGANFATGFSLARNSPLWTAFNLEKSTLDALDFGKAFGGGADCVYQDPRTLLTGSQLSCGPPMVNDSPGNDPTSLAYIFPPDLANGPENAALARLSSNVITMYSTFRTGIWRRFWDLAATWIPAKGPLRVVMGPVFDSAPPFGFMDDFAVPRPPPPRRRRDDPVVALPSHFFVILSRDQSQPKCDTESCRHDLRVFVLPHRPENKHPCQRDQFYFLTHTATVRDVELLTGLTFFTSLSTNEAARLKTRLTDALWNATPL